MTGYCYLLKLQKCVYGLKKARNNRECVEGYTHIRAKNKNVRSIF
jgi:hypothetical protein